MKSQMKTRAMGIENESHSIQFYLMTVLKVIFLFQQLHRQMVIQIQLLTILSEEPLVMNPENQVKFQLDFQMRKLNSDFCSRQSVSSTPLAPRKVTRHKIQNRPGHDGQGYPDFRISSDDSDNERIIAQKHQMRADRPETKHMSTDMTNLTEKQAKKPVAMRQYSLPRSVFIWIIHIVYIIW